MEPQRTSRPWLWFAIGAVLAGSTVAGIMRQRETRQQFGPNIRYMKIGGDGVRGYVVTNDGRLIWLAGLQAREVPLPPPGYTIDKPSAFDDLAQQPKR